mgnify:CR=1 FL=1
MNKKQPIKISFSPVPPFINISFMEITITVPILIILLIFFVGIFIFIQNNGSQLDEKSITFPTLNAIETRIASMPFNNILTPIPQFTNISIPTMHPTDATQPIPDYDATFKAIATQTELARPTSTPTPQPILTFKESTSLNVVNESGILIGIGEIRVYYADTVASNNTTRVELELHFIEQYITATPFSPVTVIPITHVTSTPHPMRPTPTPRIAQYVETGINLQELMGASLLCLPSSFSGCDEKVDPSQFKLIQVRGAFWSWTLSPSEGVKGIQDLRLEIWTLISVNDSEAVPNNIWEYPFSITVEEYKQVQRDESIISKSNITGLSPDKTEQLIFIALGIIGLIILSITSFILKNKGNRNVIDTQREEKNKIGLKSIDKLPKKQPIITKSPTAFISYRRKETADASLIIYNRLSELGADIFRDIDDLDDLGAGPFAEKLLREIEIRDYFILLIGAETFESEWVKRETEHALSLGKLIIPILKDGLDFPKLPANLEKIKDQQAIKLYAEHYESGIERIARLMGLVEKIDE